MQLYSGPSEQFIEKAITNEIAFTLRENFRRYLGYFPSQSESRSWLISLKDLAFSMQTGQLEDTGILVEYRLPMSSKRLDAMITGVGEDHRERAVIVELKQWQAAYKCRIDDCVTLSEGDLTRIHPHPSRQAGSYAEYLKGAHTAFYCDTGDDYVELNACSFLHQANSKNCGDLLDPSYNTTLSTYPLFTGDERTTLEEFLKSRLGAGDGRPVLQRVLKSRYMPSKKLLDHVAEIIDGNRVFTLLDEQLVAFNLVRSKIRELARTTNKAVVLVVGGPGTGKSVIAVRVLADLAREGRNVVHCTGSKAFTTNLRARVDRHAAVVFKYFNSFVEEEPNTVDVVVADEAHRLRANSNDRFHRKSTKTQIFEILDAAKVSLFLLDDNQVVRPGEVGTPELIRESARTAGAELYEITLEGQYRCSGSESYLRWLDHIFDLGGDPDISWRDEYDFEICDNPQELEKKVRARFEEGHSSRLVAGFCWPWSKPNSDGSLVPDVQIGGWRRPWNRKETGSLPPQKHPYTIWATKDQGIDEVGCIYSAQGFEFDYCGVIVGNDLVWRANKNDWAGLKENSYDSVVKKSQNLKRHLCNTYRVLLSRGMLGTYVCFLDSDTRLHFESMLGSKSLTEESE